MVKPAVPLLRKGFPCCSKFEQVARAGQRAQPLTAVDFGLFAHRELGGSFPATLWRMSGYFTVLSLLALIAALAARGETTVSRVYHLDRGFERLEEKLSACGANVRRIVGDGEPED